MTSPRALVLSFGLSAMIARPLLKHGGYLSRNQRGPGADEARTHHAGESCGSRDTLIGEVGDATVIAAQRLDHRDPISINVTQGHILHQVIGVKWIRSAISHFPFSYCRLIFDDTFNAVIEKSTMPDGARFAARLTQSQPNIARHSSRIPTPTKKIRKYRSALRSILRVTTYPSVSELRVLYPQHRVAAPDRRALGVKDGHLFPSLQYLPVPRPAGRSNTFHMCCGAETGLSFSLAANTEKPVTPIQLPHTILSKARPSGSERIGCSPGRSVSIHEVAAWIG